MKEVSTLPAGSYVETTMTRRVAWIWLRCALRALWYGEQRIVLCGPIVMLVRDNGDWERP